MAKKAKTIVSRYDSADYLRSEEEIAAYVQAALGDGPFDAAHFAVVLGTVARARGMMDLAKKTGLTREGLYKALSEDGNPSLDTALKVMSGLGLKFSVEAAGSRSHAR